MQFFTAILSALALAVSTTTATPVDARGALIVVNPPVTSPKAGDLWTVGAAELVKWDTSGIPDQAKDYTGSIVLGFDDGFSSSENLDYQNPLAQGFKLTDGQTWVHVPLKPYGTSYFVVLMGDSGNESARFTILTD